MKQAKAKFRLGQVVLNRYYRDSYIKLRSKKFGAAKNNSEVWAYSSSTPAELGFGTVWFEETMLRPLTRRERGEKSR